MAPYIAVSDEHVGFFCQQAVEKALKSVLSFRGVVYRRTHDLSELIELATDNSIAIPESLALSVNLTPFAVAFRYDLLPPGGDAGELFDRTGSAALELAAVRWGRNAVEGGGP